MVALLKDEDLKKLENCRALLCIENGKEKYCGDVVMGKKTYCVRHSHDIRKVKNGGN